jgi:DNA gyrase subunit B
MHFKAGPVKLIDSKEHGPGCELLVVEGDSAAGAVASLRDATFQAVLPMQGKPMNALRATPAKAAAYPLFAALEASLGLQPRLASSAALTLTADQLTSLRFERVVLLFDPDADGIHCGALMLMYFYRRLRPLLQAGGVHMVYPPWLQFTLADTAEQVYAVSQAHGQKLADQFRAAGRAFDTQRPRGLAGIDSALLQRLCVAPATRTSRVVGEADALLAIEVFDSPLT